MSNPFDDQSNFMQACDQSVGVPNPEQAAMYVKLIAEEMNELLEAIEAQDKIEILDALVDIMVVTIGAGHSIGADVQGAWDEVMRTNFAKIDQKTGKVKKREDGKVLKPSGWTAPDLTPYVK